MDIGTVSSLGIGTSQLRNRLLIVFEQKSLLFGSLKGLGLCLDFQLPSQGYDYIAIILQVVKNFTVAILI